MFLKIPSAFPIAITSSPSSSEVALPISMVGKLFLGGRTVRIATSFTGSRLKIVPGNFSPFESTTVYSACSSLTTCLLVRITPMESTRNPEPPPIVTMPRLSTSVSGIWRWPPSGVLGRNGSSSAGISFSRSSRRFAITIDTTAGRVFLIVWITLISGISIILPHDIINLMSHTFWYVILGIVIILVGIGIGAAWNSTFSQNVVSSPTPSEISPAVPVISPAQLQVRDVTVGKGTEAKPGDKVSVTYKGTLQDGTVFDASNLHGNAPFTFTLGAGEVIQGWDQGVAGMKVGGKRVLVIPPQLAYGSQAVGSIPPNSTLTFEVDLLQVNGKN